MLRKEKLQIVEEKMKIRRFLASALLIISRSCILCNTMEKQFIASQDCLNKAIDYNTIAVVLNAANRKLENETRVSLHSKAAVKKVNSI